MADIVCAVSGSLLAPTSALEKYPFLTATSFQLSAGERAPIMDETGDLSRYIITSVFIIVSGPRRPDGAVPEQFGVQGHG
eukprot:3272715-Pyramimonas_sp.AAC.1